jgi:hypothetical protein
MLHLAVASNKKTVIGGWKGECSRPLLSFWVRARGLTGGDGGLETPVEAGPLNITETARGDAMLLSNPTTRAVKPGLARGKEAVRALHLNLCRHLLPLCSGLCSTEPRIVDDHGRKMCRCEDSEDSEGHEIGTNSSLVFFFFFFFLFSPLPGEWSFREGRSYLLHPLCKFQETCLSASPFVLIHAAKIRQVTTANLMTCTAKSLTPFATGLRVYLPCSLLDTEPK